MFEFRVVKSVSNWQIEALDSVAQADGLRQQLFSTAKGGDVCGVFPASFVPKIIFMDMDATVIEQESLVEISREFGLQDQIKAITENAMAGEMDFSASLKARVSLLKGKSVSCLEQVASRITINPGVADLVKCAADAGVSAYLISGGFMELAEPIAQSAGFAGVHANRFAVSEAQFTGEVEGEIVDAEAKVRFAERTCQQQSIDLKDALMVGDGANDIPLMKRVGLGIGFHPKNVVRDVVQILNLTGSHECLTKLFNK